MIDGVSSLEGDLPSVSWSWRKTQLSRHGHSPTEVNLHFTDRIATRINCRSAAVV